MLQQVYEIGLEKFAGDHDKAVEFTEGFLKEASTFGSLMGQGAQAAAGRVAGKAAPAVGRLFADSVVKTLGAGAAGLAAGLAIHGVSSGVNALSKEHLYARFKQALETAIQSNQVLRNEPRAKIENYAKTVFDFAPHVAGDPNLLGNVLASAVHGDSMDLSIIRTLSDLEARYNDTRKNALFSPKTYL